MPARSLARSLRRSLVRPFARSLPRSLARPLALALIVAGAAGCPHDGPTPHDAAPSCDDTIIGDPSLPPEAVIVDTDGLSSALADVADGDAVPLGRPPQGGQVSYIGARVRNLSRCNVQLEARYRDPTTKTELAFDGRTIDLVVGADGWGRPDASQVANLANVPLCPDNDPTRDNGGQPALLEVTVTDRSGRVAMAAKTVVPTCTAPDPTARALCVCECNHLPATGRMCGAAGDGGM